MENYLDAADACLSLSNNTKVQLALTKLMFLLFYPAQILRLKFDISLVCPTLAGPVEAVATPTTAANTNCGIGTQGGKLVSQRHLR